MHYVAIIGGAIIGAMVTVGAIGGVQRWILHRLETGKTKRLRPGSLADRVLGWREEQV